ncbi:hypothetical protein PP724_22945 [Ralstonia solanacearum]|uniref:hypothetical protein n=1 Tax=Ralstonia solanacearum TaxID=305 RepID=UPI001FF7718C|nr:hypothetical protein [Ralstonia solanacearum]MDC6237025.1 hypothetical protein [Ralstonia solanacearum]MDD7810572.1 hypothetical protein [Ralstonia solanacearum]
MGFTDDGAVMFGRAMRAERNANEWAAYARKLEAQVRQLKTTLSSVEQDRNVIRNKLDALAEKYVNEQARAIALEALQRSIVGELAKVSPGNPLVSPQIRAEAIEKAKQAALALPRVKVKL